MTHRRPRWRRRRDGPEHVLSNCACPDHVIAISAPDAKRTFSALFDHLVGEQLHPTRNGKAERLSVFILMTNSNLFDMALGGLGHFAYPCDLNQSIRRVP